MLYGRERVVREKTRKRSITKTPHTDLFILKHPFRGKISMKSPRKPHAYGEICGGLPSIIHSLKKLSNHRHKSVSKPPFWLALLLWPRRSETDQAAVSIHICLPVYFRSPLSWNISQGSPLDGLISMVISFDYLNTHTEHVVGIYIWIHPSPRQNISDNFN